jgi:Redoxin
MFGRERSLVKRFADKPFVLLGVNADESPERLRQIQEQAHLNWASWWDGPDASISTGWKVDRFPSFFLIDRQGVIRWREVGAPSAGVLSSKIEELLREPEKRSTS